MVGSTIHRKEDSIGPNWRESEKMYHPTGRVLAVLELLQSRSLVSGAELAQRLEMDVRTVRRYIMKLQDVGIPVESVRGQYGGYRLRPGFRMPPLVFTEDEVVAVIVALIANTSTNLSLPKPSVESALSKMTRVLPKTTWDRIRSLVAVSVITQESVGRRFSAATILQLSQAAADRSCVSLVYQAQEETTERIVEPYGITGFQGHWYMVGFCRLRQALRVFRLDRIDSCLMLSDHFQIPANFDTEQYIKDCLEKVRHWKVHIRFDASGDDIRLLLGHGGDITPTDSGHDYVGMVSDLDFTARTLLFGGLSCQILKPPQLKTAFVRIADRARELSQ